MKWNVIVLAAGAMFCMAGVASAKLPAPTDAQKAAAAEAAAKTAHANKVAAYRLCEAENRIQARYIEEQKAKGRTVTPQLVKGCENPGPYQPAAAKQ
jgi:hypothetical protein